MPNRSHNGVSRTYVRMHIVNMYLTTLISRMNTEIEGIYYVQKEPGYHCYELTSVQVRVRENSNISQWS